MNMNEKELLEMLYQLGNNSKRSRSFAASDSMNVKEKEDQVCANTLRKIITGHFDGTTEADRDRKSFAASDPTTNTTAANRPATLINFVLNNGKL